MEKEPFFNCSELNQQAEKNLSADLNFFKKITIENIKHSPSSIISRIKNIKNELNNLSEKDQKEIKKVLKKILLIIPAWREEAKYIKQNFKNFIYAPEEKKELNVLKKREEKIKKEIHQGKWPWLAKIEYNKKNTFNPFIIGFYQMPDGQLKTIFGQKYFQSKRQLISKNPIIFLSIQGQEQEKKVGLLSTKFQKVDNCEILKSNLFSLLPADLRSQLQKGKILITGKQDLYDLEETEAENIAASKNANALIKHIESKIAQQKENSYFLLHQSGYFQDKIGRTGVLMVIKNKKLQPVIIKINNKEFIIEIKGCGKRGGGFGEKQYRTGRDIITGGVEREQAINEFQKLSELSEEDSPKAIASILFDNNGYQQGYILRLSPSTVRASYGDNNAYPEIDSPENVSKILNIYAQNLASQIFAAKPKIMDESSHTENILLWGDKRHTFTDFSDQVYLSDNSYPHEGSDGIYLTPKKMLYFYIKMAEEIPGYQAEKNKKMFLKYLEVSFAEKGHSLSFEKNDSYEQVTEKIWKNILAYQVFHAKKINNYKAKGVVKEFKEKLNKILPEGENLKEKYEKKRQEIIKAAQKQKENPEIKKICELTERNDFLPLIKAIVERTDIFDIWEKDKNLSQEEIEKIHEAISYFTDLRTLLKIIKRYLDYEKELLAAAQNSAPAKEKVIIKKAEKELEEKIKEFSAATGQPQKLLEKLADLNWLENFLTFKTYSAK